MINYYDAKPKKTKKISFCTKNVNKRKIVNTKIFFNFALLYLFNYLFLIYL